MLSNSLRILSLWMMVSLLVLTGCHHPSMTAVGLSPWNRDEPHGIPFYLPKPLLVVSKNFRYVEEAKVGLTASAPIPGVFDDQSKYADLNSRSAFNYDTAGAASPTTVTNTITGAAGGASAPVLHTTGEIPLSPNVAPKDGLEPDTFFTYQIIFVPDLSQKYGLKIRGGAGEIRAAMNLVNGWMFTGMGPYYMKDSSTAQNILATGITSNLAFRGVGDVIKEINDLRKTTAGGTQKQMAELEAEQLTAIAKNLQSIERDNTNVKVPDTFINYAEIHVYEPVLSCDGTTQWREIVNHQFNRDYFKNGGKTTIKFNNQSGTPQKAELPTPPSGHRMIVEPAKPGTTTGPGAPLGSDAPVNKTQNDQQQRAFLEQQARNSDEAMYRSIVERKLRLPPGSMSGDQAQRAALTGGQPVAVDNAVAANARCLVPPDKSLWERCFPCFHRPKEVTSTTLFPETTVVNPSVFGSGNTPLQPGLLRDALPSSQEALIRAAEGTDGILSKPR